MLDSDFGERVEMNRRNALRLLRPTSPQRGTHGGAG